MNLSTNESSRVAVRDGPYAVSAAYNLQDLGEGIGQIALIIAAKFDRRRVAALENRRLISQGRFYDYAEGVKAYAETLPEHERRYELGQLEAQTKLLEVRLQQHQNPLGLALEALKFETRI